MGKYSKSNFEYHTKLSILDSTISYLACPNDKGTLSIQNDRLVCNSCKTHFQILNENTIELIPKESFEPKIQNETTKSYSEYYSDLKTLGHSRDSKKRLWGVKTQTVPEGFVQNLRNIISQIVGNKIVCDVGAGSGDYSLILARKSQLVFHCDLDIEAIMSAREEAKKLNLDNILFIRSNYFTLPFKDNSLPCITCIDILLRGQEHDNKLLTEIFSKITNEGIVLFDFHSKERVQINKNLDLDGCYSKDEIKTLSRKYNFEIILFKGMGFAPTINKIPKFSYKIANSILSPFVNPARWFIAARKK